jgi:hypothetical protein
MPPALQVSTVKILIMQHDTNGRIHWSFQAAKLYQRGRRPF